MHTLSDHACPDFDGDPCEFWSSRKAATMAHRKGNSRPIHEDDPDNLKVRAEYNEAYRDMMNGARGFHAYND